MGVGFRTYVTFNNSDGPASDLFRVAHECGEVFGSILTLEFTGNDKSELFFPGHSEVPLLRGYAGNRLMAPSVSLFYGWYGCWIGVFLSA